MKTLTTKGLWLAGMAWLLLSLASCGDTQEQGTDQQEGAADEQAAPTFTFSEEGIGLKSADGNASPVPMMADMPVNLNFNGQLSLNPCGFQLGQMRADFRQLPNVIHLGADPVLRIEDRLLLAKGSQLNEEIALNIDLYDDIMINKNSDGGYELMVPCADPYDVLEDMRTHGIEEMYIDLEAGEGGSSLVASAPGIGTMIIDDNIIDDLRTAPDLRPCWNMNLGLRGRWWEQITVPDIAGRPIEVGTLKSGNRPWISRDDLDQIILSFQQENWTGSPCERDESQVALIVCDGVLYIVNTVTGAECSIDLATGCSVRILRDSGTLSIDVTTDEGCGPDLLTCCQSNA